MNYNKNEIWSKIVCIFIKKNSIFQLFLGWYIVSKSQYLFSSLKTEYDVKVDQMSWTILYSLTIFLSMCLWTQFQKFQLKKSIFFLLKYANCTLCM